MRPEVLKRAGVIIAPLKFSKASVKAAENGLQSVSAKRASVALVSAGSLKPGKRA